MTPTEQFSASAFLLGYGVYIAIGRKQLDVCISWPGKDGNDSFIYNLGHGWRRE